MGLSSDIELVNRITQQDEQAFLSLYDRYSPRVYGLILRIVRDIQTAEELTQDVFLKLWDRAKKFDSVQGDFAPWILTVARNTALDRLRKDQRRPYAPNEFDPEDTWELILDEKTTTDEARWRSLYFIMRSLPVEQRVVIEFSYYQGLRQSDIADQLKIPLGTVKTRMRLGMDQLRRQWLENEPEERKSDRTPPDVVHKE